jgi:DNA-binding MarR family transcriptional regulator
MGLVSRTADESDRRVTRLTLTPEGAKRLERNRTRKNAWLAQQLRALGPEERAALEAVVPVLEHLVAHGSGADQGLPARTSRP